MNQTKPVKNSRKQAVALEVNGRLYFDLVDFLRQNGDPRSPDDVAALAIKSWMAEHGGAGGRRGYQWKELFLPDGTELRMRYLGICYFARVEGNDLKYGCESLSPLEWTRVITGTVRNPWRDIWIRRDYRQSWMRAAQWRNDCRSAMRRGSD